MPVLTLPCNRRVEFPENSVYIYGIEQNYLRSVKTNLYYPDDVESIQLPTLSDGKLDAVAGLYSMENIKSFSSSFDYYGIQVGADKIVGQYKDPGSTQHVFLNDGRHVPE